MSCATRATRKWKQSPLHGESEKHAGARLNYDGKTRSGVLGGPAITVVTRFAAPPGCAPGMALSLVDLRDLVIHRGDEVE